MRLLNTSLLPVLILNVFLKVLKLEVQKIIVLTSRVNMLIKIVNAHIDLTTLFPDISEEGLLDFT